MKEIVPTQGQVALVDDEDFERLNQYKWTAVKSKAGWYAQRKLKTKNKNGYLIKIKMHRSILGLGTLEENKILVDHIDHNGLNNQKSNLRLATSLQNGANCRNRTDGVSKYKGVTYRGNTWVARIGVNNQRIYLGSYRTEKEAAIADNEAAKQHFGDFAYLNII